MYIVVSKWAVTPGMEEEFEKRSKPVRDVLRQTNGAKFVNGFRTASGEVVAVHAYDTEADYNRIVNDANGPFAKAVAEHRLEDVSHWISSERGESIDN